MNYEESINWLYGTQQFGIKLGLENAKRLLSALEVDVDKPGPGVIHVAGTNGKGSVCAFSEAILREGGLRTGLFTSPHLVHYRERIRVNGVEISEAALLLLLTRIRTLVADWEAHPTFFEITLAAAMRYFLDQACDVLILETGMGGRFDATNTIRSDVAVITSVALDHQQWLGDTIREIAAEKAGIIKPETPVVIGELHPDAREVVGYRALELRVPCIEAHPLPEEWKLGLPGAHQRGNASLAVEASCRLAGDELTREGIARALENTRWPGRLERIGNVVLDGAHNPESARALAAAWKEIHGDRRCHLVFGAVMPKDVKGVLEALLPLAWDVTLVKVSSERGLATADLERILRSLSDDPVPVAHATSVRDALERQDAAQPVLVAGSLYLVGEALACLKGGAFESSLQ